MKKFLIFLMSLTICFTACGKTDVSSHENESVADVGYTTLVCEKTEEYKTMHFADKDSESVLTLTLPEKWLIRRGDAGYNIYNRHGLLGNITLADSPNNHDTRCLKHTTREDNNISTMWCILKSQKSDGCGYSHAITYSFGDSQNITLEVEYTSLDNTALARVDRFAEIVKLENKASLGSIPLSKGNGKNAVLILGNSFIGTSKVGEILEKMIIAGNKNVSVEAVTRGYANIQKYIERGDYIEKVRAGDYGILFMCGIYSDNDVGVMHKLIDVCKESNTMLVLFPAHNESKTSVQKAVVANSDRLYFLDWQGEIDMLINSGLVGRWDMCYDDEHDHSRPLAGFVGAHMIYREMFGEIPPQIFGEMSTSLAERYLRDYVSTGVLAEIYESEINRF